jgi:predicted transposase/invertase (TIGR01784 family)
MKVIDPLVDCVFKGLLGSEDNKPLLLHFLNALLQWPEPKRLLAVELISPFNERETLEDKLTVVDVKARDQAGNSFQIEVQVETASWLPHRMLYCWSDIYQYQLQQGHDFHELRPVIAIWILAKNLLKEEGHHHRFELRDARDGCRLTDQLAIHTLELPKWRRADSVSEEDRWMYLLSEGSRLDLADPPEILNTKEMRMAVKELKRWSEREENYHLYQSRMNAMRVQQSQAKHLRHIQEQLNQERLEKERERLEKEQALQAQERERLEKERLLALLKQQGIDPQSRD